ncbi:DNA replication factor Cdt1 [Intoshia linei]|uniref:DNA replication factor Cdt1 n=1 Tax=Intoshia linei TaxID=1819745 RepID=A0A177AXN6_9BILA|nr:DNA replication factor Cdt1 [Intoshia linei]
MDKKANQMKQTNMENYYVNSKVIRPQQSKTLLLDDKKRTPKRQNKIKKSCKPVKKMNEKSNTIKQKIDTGKRKPLKIDPVKVKNALKKCTNLNELKSKLIQFDKNVIQSEIGYSSPNFHQDDNIVSILNKSPLKKAMHSKISFNKSVSRKLDFSRCEINESTSSKFASLTSLDNLPMPIKFSNLLDTFKTLDTVLGMFGQRKETATFGRIKSVVERMTRRNFTKKAIYQIVTVFPEAYIVEQIKNIPLPSCIEPSSEYQLCIRYKNEPIDKLCDYYKRRKIQFHEMLLERVYTAHDNFLQKVSKKLKVDIKVDKTDIIRWHVDFMPDKHVEDIEEAEHIQYKNQKVLKTADQVLSEISKQCFTKKMQEAYKMAEIIRKCSLKSDKLDTIQEKTIESKDLDKKYKGISKKLLNKVRSTQAAKTYVDMTRNSSAQKMISKYSNVPEIARIIRVFFILNKTKCLPYSQVINKIMDSLPNSISEDEIHSSLEALIQVYSEWISFVQVNNVKYVKTSNITMNYADLLGKINAIKKTF